VLPLPDGTTHPSAVAQRRPKPAGLAVCGVSFEVHAYRVSKAVWLAAGQFRGRFVQAKGRTASGAIDAVKSKVEGQEFN
jgi:hypothetical protein